MNISVFSTVPFRALMLLVTVREPGLLKLAAQISLLGDQLKLESPRNTMQLNNKNQPCS